MGENEKDYEKEAARKRELERKRTRERESRERVEQKKEGIDVGHHIFRSKSYTL